MTALLIALALATPTDDRPRGGAVVGGDSTIGFDDDVQLTFGGSDDISLHYDSADTRFEIGNATGLALQIDDGSTTVTMAGVSTTALTLGGDVTGSVAVDWDLIDNNASALSFDTAGLAGMLEFDTSDGSERLRTSVPLLQFGGTSATEVALKPNGTEMQLRLADDSGWGNLQAGAMTLNGALDMTGNLISDSTGAVQHGTAGTPGSAGAGDDYFGGDVEIDGLLEADGGIDTGTSNFATNRITVGANDYVYFTGGATIYGPTATDKTDFMVEGSGTFERTRARTNVATLTFAANPGDASKTATALIPDGASLVGFSSRVVTTGTNCTSIDIGVAGDTDMFADNAGIVDGNTTNNTHVTAGWSTQALNPALANMDVIVTGVGGNCFSLVIALHVHYVDTVAATVDP